jgi:hypothetical protein
MARSRANPVREKFQAIVKLRSLEYLANACQSEARAKSGHTQPVRPQPDSAVHGISTAQQRSPSFWRRACLAAWAMLCHGSAQTLSGHVMSCLLVAANLKIGIRAKGRKGHSGTQLLLAHHGGHGSHGMLIAHCSPPQEGQLSHDLLPVPRTRSPAPMPVSADAQQRECAVLCGALLCSTM